MNNIISNNSIVLICNEILDRLSLFSSPNKIIVLGIDGPTAAGKTLFAKNLSEIFKSRTGKSGFIFQLDWTLVSREDRVADQKTLFNTKPPARFELEAELHMRLAEAELFLQQLSKFNQLVDVKDKTKVFEITLSNLYSRENEGRVIGRQDVCIEPGSLVILEGHYTLRPELNKYIDVNTLLLSDKSSLLERKISRVQGYRGAEEAEQYFHFIDVPSFETHLQRFGRNAAFVIQNDNYEAPFFTNQSSLGDWCAQILPNEINKGNASSGVGEIDDFLVEYFSESKLLPGHLKKVSKVLISNLVDLDIKIAEKIISSVEDQSVGLTEVIQSFLSRCNTDLIASGVNKTVKLRFTNSLYNVYFRIFPISFAVSLDNDNDNSNLSFLFDFFEEKIQICIAWNGGVRFLNFNRTLEHERIGRLSNWTVVNPSEFNAGGSYDACKTLLLTPTDFTLPPIFEGIDFEIRLTGKEHLNISPSDCFRQLAGGNVCWVARLGLQDEVNFFSRLCSLIGAETVTIGNYLIALLTDNRKLAENFKIFSSAWQRSYMDLEELDQDISAHDYLVLNERSELAAIVRSKYPIFEILDTHLFLKAGSLEGENFSLVLKNIAEMLESDNRLLRKRVIQFIDRQFGKINLPVKNIWPDLSDSEAIITLDDLSLMQPTILAELYLWLSIKDAPSAILGANVYDISPRSLDATGHLQAAIKQGCPVVLQASLNALGQDEGFGPGYLKPENGAKDLVDAVLTSLRALYAYRELPPPLFGIGLDHVDSRNDRPPGRARRFLEDSISTRLVTHAVLDGSSLFDAKDGAHELVSAYQKVAEYAANLVQGMEKSFLIDKEICGGELNYIGSSKLANIPNASEIKIFSDTIKKYFRQKKLGSYLRRPMLFIGNVGTTHHSGDVGEVNPEITKTWIDVVKKDLFVSAVLHGTTGTASNILMRATAGCKKVNVAGDFLHTYLKALPSAISDLIIKENAKEPKKALAVVRQKIQALTELEKSNISESILEHSRSLMQKINSPFLSPSDVNFFRYSPYVFNQSEISEIIRQIKLSVDGNSSGDHAKLNQNAFKGIFCASLIEVPYGEQFTKIASELISSGIKNFHIDVGDGEFVTRQFSGLAKLEKLKQICPDVEANVHFMVRDPHLKGEDNPKESYIESYARNGCNRIGIHINSVSNLNQVRNCFDQIRLNGSEPGLILEVDEPFDSEVGQLVLDQNVKWIVVMGVRVGFGGQIFNTSSIQKIQMIRQFSDEHDLGIQIEVDGGLTKDNIRACLLAGANYFAGWSIIKPDEKTGMHEKLSTVMRILSNKIV